MKGLDCKIIRLRRKKKLRQVSQRVDGMVSEYIVHHRIKESKNIVRRHMCRIPLLKKERRLLWAKDHIHWKDEWMQSFFQMKRNLTWMNQVVGTPTDTIYDVNLEPSPVGKKEKVL